MKRSRSRQLFIMTLWAGALFLAAGSSASALWFGADVQLDSHNSQGYQRAESVGDIDNDGSPDIVGEDAGHTLFVTRDLAGTPHYEPQTHLAPEDWELYGTALADFDGDGYLDLVTAGPDGEDDSPNNVYSWDNSAKRYEKVGSTLTLFSQAIYGYDVLAGDFNNDGRPDALWLGWDAAYLAINSTTSPHAIRFSSFTTTPLPEGGFTRGAMGSALGDFNGDGNLDFITCKDDWNDGNWGGTYVIGYGDGNGGFTVESGGNFNDGLRPVGVAVGDFNRDGRDDFVLVRMNYSTMLNELLLYTRTAANDGFDVTVLRTDVSGMYWGAVVADINGDGWPDILFEPDTSSWIAVHLNQGDDTFLPVEDARISASHYQFFVLDVNGDGRKDLLVSEDTIYYKPQVVLQTLTTDEVSGWDEDSQSATGYGTITANGYEITERGFCYNATGSPSMYDGSCYGESGPFVEGPFSLTIPGLEGGAIYYIRAYAASSDGIAYGNEIVFEPSGSNTTTTAEEETTTTIEDDTTTIPDDTTTIPDDTTTIPDDTTTIPEDTSTTTTSVYYGSIITTVAGNGSDTFNGDNRQAVKAGISPRVVAFDGSGNMYISDSNNNRIRKVNASGVITTVAGSGQVGYNGDGGQATAAKLNYPCGMTVDSAGNVLFTDVYNFRIRKVDASGVITTVAGTGESGYNGDGGQATAAQLNYVFDIAVDSSDTMYIADYFSQRIRKVDTSGIITTVAGTGGDYGYSGDGGPATDAQLSYPSIVTADSAGAVYFADSNNNRIRKVSASGTITTVAGTGNLGYSGDGGPATDARVGYPAGLAVDASGTLYFSDGNRVRKVSAAGIVTTIAGTGDAGYSGDGGPATDAQVANVFGVTLDRAGTSLYIADADNYRIRKIDKLTAADTDGDGVPDDSDNCPSVYNPAQKDANANGTGDCCDPSPGCGGCGQPACDTQCAHP